MPGRTGFSIEESDLFSDDKIPDVRRKSISSIVNQRLETKEETQYKVFRRELPVREQLLQNSVADWAAGSKVDHTIGPLTGVDGREFWYDFYPIEKLISLYMQGISDPVLLFKIKENNRIVRNPNVPVRASLTKTYSLGERQYLDQCPVSGSQFPCGNLCRPYHQWRKNHSKQSASR